MFILTYRFIVIVIVLRICYLRVSNIRRGKNIEITQQQRKNQTVGNIYVFIAYFCIWLLINYCFVLYMLKFCFVLITLQSQYFRQV